MRAVDRHVGSGWDLLPHGALPARDRRGLPVTPSVMAVTSGRVRAAGSHEAAIRSEGEGGRDRSDAPFAEFALR